VGAYRIDSDTLVSSFIPNVIKMSAVCTCIPTKTYEQTMYTKIYRKCTSRNVFLKTTELGQCWQSAYIHGNSTSSQHMPSACWVAAQHIARASLCQSTEHIELVFATVYCWPTAL